MFSLIVVYLLGAFTGIGAMVAYLTYSMTRLRKANDKLMKDIKEKTANVEEKVLTIKNRLLQAADIAQQQMDLRAQLDLPSKNALHSKYKNQIVAQLADLEYQKIDLLKTILAEGYDPLITIIGDAGNKEEIHLSTYVDQATTQLSESGFANNTPPPPVNDTPDVNVPRKAGKFMIYKGGKDDGTTH